MPRKDKVRNGMPFGDKRVFESLTCQSAIKVSLYKCTVLSVLRLYGSETWTLANPCHLRSKDSSSASLATHFAATSEDRVNRSIRPVCTIWRETKCWRPETFVFTIHLKGHWGRLRKTDGTCCWDRDYWSHLVASCRVNRFDPQTKPYTAISRKVVEKKMCTRQSRKVKWDMNNTLLFPINFAEIAVYKVQKSTDKHYFKNYP